MIKEITHHLSYCFIPCNKYCHSDDQNNFIYQLRDDIFIPIFLIPTITKSNQI